MSQQARAANQKSEVLIHAVQTRWNTVTMVLECALELRPILFNVCDKAEFNKAQGVRLCHFIIDDDDWPILEQLYELLTVSAHSHSIECSLISTSSRRHFSRQHLQSRPP